MDFCMNESDSQVVLQQITVDDFNVICRVCLQIGENMTDIFKSGIENQFMEITNLKMEIDDKLPRTLCQKCYNKICQYCIFLRLAKSTDIFLRSLLPSVSNPEELHSKPARSNVHKKKKFFKKNSKKLVTQSQEVITDVDSDKMYLIFVPETGSGETEMDNKIFIKDLNSDSDNLEVTNYCKTFVRSHFSDHTYPKEQEGPDNDDIRTLKSNQFPDLRNQENETYTENLHLYKGSDCEATFKEFNDLTAHLSSHEIETPFLKSNFICPICNFSEQEREIFLNHLRTHKEEGSSCIKFNAESEITYLKENKQDLFNESFLKKAEDCKIFKFSPNTLSCTVCSQTIHSIESIADHLEYCLSGVNTVVQFNIKYTCPVCCKIFFDEEKNFIKHLSCHKEENCFFIKVDSAGEPVQVAVGEELFVPFDEAVKIFDERGRIFEIVNRNPCDKCDSVLDCFNDLCEHISDIKFENTTTEIFSCPVCMSEFKKANEFYEHLAEQRNEGISFILVTKNGGLCDLNQKYSEIFTQSQFLLSVIRSPNVVFQNVFPELVIWDLKNSSGKYTCDFCQKEFKSKRKISLHMKSHEAKDRHLDSVNYICERCGKKFSTKANYKKHFLKHLRVLSSVSKRPVCTICNKKFANRATYDSHIRHHLKETNENEFHTSLPGIICDKCGRSFSNNASLTRHKKAHLKEKEKTLFKCEICHRDFLRQSSFDRHKSAHLNPKYYECGTCKLPLPTVTSLQKHLETHKTGSKTFDCKNCQLSFLTKDSLTAHQSHTGHYVDKKPFECNVCHEKFFLGKKFTEHIKTHPKYKVGECTLCGKRLSTPDSLMKHRRRHFESNTVLCPHCGKRFFEDKNYERHLMIHEGIKPFPCDLEGCEKAFYTGFELRRHKKYHSNERDFKCSFCPKSFTEASHLTTHIRIHTGERPYRCPHCNKGFQTRSHCKNHIRLIHQGVGYDLIRTNISKKVAFFEGVEQTD